MRAVVIAQVFPPEPVVSSRTSFDVASGLAARGHQVTVLAPFPSRPAGRLYPNYARRLFHTERANGFRLIRCFSTLSSKSSLLSRSAENLSFGLTSSLRLMTLRKPDVVYVNTWPVLAAALTAAAARLRRIPMIVSVQDVYPESLVAQGRTTLESAISRLFLAMDRFVVKRASAVILISSQFARHYGATRGLAADRMLVVPNWLPADGSEEVAGAAAEARARNSISAEALLITYGGNVGAAAGLETVIEAFGDPGLNPNIHLLVAGSGTALESCRRLAAAVAPHRIHFQPEWSGSMDVLHAADAVVLPTRGDQSAASVPSKLVSYLFSARPVIAMVREDSATADMVREAACGIVTPAGDAGAFAASANAIAAMSADERRRMGAAGRAWSLRNVTSDVCLPPLLDLIEKTGGDR
jgi:glycosyltransferase involved in cell wall biosynthesis